MTWFLIKLIIGLILEYSRKIDLVGEVPKCSHFEKSDFLKKM